MCWLTKFKCAFHGSHFSQRHTSLSVELQVGEVKDQADGWNLSVVFQARGMTSYSNLTSVFLKAFFFFQRALQSVSSSYSISLPILSTVIKQEQVADILTHTLFLESWWIHHWNINKRSSSISSGLVSSVCLTEALEATCWNLLQCFISRHPINNTSFPITSLCLVSV